MAVYNKFFNKEKWKQVNKENKDIVDDYILEIRSQKKSEGTVKTYYNNLQIALIIILEEYDNKSILEMTKKDWRGISLYLQDKNMSHSRVNTFLSSVRSLLTFAEDDNDYEYEFNTCSKVKGLKKKEARPSVFLTDEQICKLEDVLVEREEWQKLTLLFLAYDSCARKAELHRVLKHSFYDDSLDYTNEVIGKRGKTFELTYFSKTKKYAKKWLDARGEDEFDSLWLRIDKDGNRRLVTKATIYGWVKYFNSILENIENRKIGLSPHSLRHSSLDNLSMDNPIHYALLETDRSEGLGLDELQLHANHQSSETTRGYLIDRSNEKKLSMFNLNTDSQNQEKKGEKGE